MLNYETFHDDSNYFLKLYDCTFNYYKEKICEKYINFQQLFRWFVQKGSNKCFPFLNLENIYLLAVDHRNTRKRRGISSKLTIKTLQRRPAVFTVSFVHIFHLFPVFLLLTLNRKMLGGSHCVKSVRIRVIPVRIFPHSDWIWVSLRIQSKCGKMRTRITLNMDTFRAVSMTAKLVTFFH